MGPAIPVVGTFLLLAAASFGVFSIRDRLSTLRARVDAAWSQIAVQLARRHELAAALIGIATARGAHERGTVGAVIDACEAAIAAETMSERSAAEDVLTRSIRGLFALTAAFPDLGADSAFLGLQDELTGAESKVAYARQFYNEAVASYNAALQPFPRSLLARALGFSAAEYFEVETGPTVTVQATPG